MTDVSDDELLRLARKAWPDSERVAVSVDGPGDRDPFVEIYLEHGGYKCVEIGWHPDAQAALHAALTVLAGEEHHPNAELGDALDAIADLRDRLDRALVSAESLTADLALERRHKHDANGRAQKLVSVAELAVAALMRHGHGDVARDLSEALKKAIEG